MSPEERDDSFLISSRRSLPAKTALVQRGIELADTLRAAAARRRLYQAWMDFLGGCDLARDKGMLGYLIDAFGEGVGAVALWMGIELEDDHPTEVLARELLRAVDAKANLIFGRETERLVTRMEKLFGRETLNTDLGRAYYQQIVQHELENFIVELKTFLDDVAGLIDPTRATTSLEYVVLHYDELFARENVKAIVLFNTGQSWTIRNEIVRALQENQDLPFNAAVARSFGTTSLPERL